MGISRDDEKLADSEEPELGDERFEGSDSPRVRERKQLLWRWAGLIGLTLAVFLWGAWGVHRGGADLSGAAASAGATWYSCTMPECNDPGSADPESRCPVCGMKREPVVQEAPALAWYRCTMPECNDPGSADPESRCPVCGMKREPVSAADLSAVGAPVLTLDRAARELASLATEPVMHRELLRRIRSAGTISFDERRYVVVSARAAGTVESLHADYNGIRVAADQELMQIYSLELLQAQNELLRLIWGFGRIPGRGRNRSVDQDLVTARHKLELLGVTPNEIDLLIERDHEDPFLRVRSPISGTVIRKQVFEGQWVRSGDTLFEIADLSHLWLLLDIYEEELPWLRLGQRVSVSTPSLPGERFSGLVSFIDPVVEPATRTVKLRVELANPQHRLKPGMYVTAHVVTRLAPVDSQGAQTSGLLAVPREAILETGERSIAYVELAPGTYRGVKVVLGSLAEDASGRHYYPVVSGLEEGQLVVTRGAFVIDSQMQISGKPSLFDVRGQGHDVAAEDRQGQADTASHGMDHGSASASEHVTTREQGLPPTAPTRRPARHQVVDDEAGVAAQPVCPVTGNPSDPSVYVDYRGVRIYFCCHLCTPKFLADPEEFTAALPEPVQERLREAEQRLKSELGT